MFWPTEASATRSISSWPARDRFSIESDDDVASFQAALFRGPAWLNLLHEDARRAAVAPHQFTIPILIRAERNADRSARHFAGLDDLVIDLDRGVDGQRESDALIPAAAAGDHRVNADHFAVDVQQRTAAVAGVNGRIGLQEVLEPSSVWRSRRGCRAIWR